MATPSFAEQTKTIYNPFSGRLDYITKIDSTTDISVKSITYPDGSNQTTAGGGSGGGVSVYPATATASFPYGLSVSTINASGDVSVGGNLTNAGNFINYGTGYIAGTLSVDGLTSLGAASISTATMSLATIVSTATFQGPIIASGTAGTSGQILTSFGPGNKAYWSTAISTAGYVPYVGANAGVDLGTNTLTSGGIVTSTITASTATITQIASSTGVFTTRLSVGTTDAGIGKFTVKGSLTTPNITETITAWALYPAFQVINAAETRNWYMGMDSSQNLVFGRGYGFGQGLPRDLVIDGNTDNVGIHVTSPANPLDISGKTKCDAQIEGDTLYADNGVYVHSSGAGSSSSSSLQGQVHIYDDLDNHSVTIEAPTAMTQDLTIDLPVTNGTSGQAVITDGAGIWSYGNVISGVTAGTDLTGGGTSGVVTLNLDTSKVILNQATLQSGTTAYPQYLYVGSTATIPGLSGSTITYSSASLLGVSGSTMTYSSGTITNLSLTQGTFTRTTTSSTATFNGAIVTNGSAGTFGQVLVSSGTDLPTFWSWGAYSVKTTTVTLATSEEVIFSSAVSNGVGLNLPTAVGNGGKRYRIKKVDTTTNNTTITPSGSQQVDGAASLLLTYYGQAVDLISDNFNWFVF